VVNPMNENKAIDISGCWSPRREAEYQLDFYKYFFLRPDEDIQEIENTLDDQSPENWCYLWIWENIFNVSEKSSVYCDVIGVPNKKLAVYLKLTFNLEPFDIEKKCQVRYIDQKWKAELLSND